MIPLTEWQRENVEPFLVAARREVDAITTVDTSWPAKKVSYREKFSRLKTECKTLWKDLGSTNCILIVCVLVMFCMAAVVSPRKTTKTDILVPTNVVHPAVEDDASRRQRRWDAEVAVELSYMEQYKDAAIRYRRLYPYSKGREFPRITIDQIVDPTSTTVMGYVDVIEFEEGFRLTVTAEAVTVTERDGCWLSHLDNVGDGKGCAKTPPKGFR